MKKVIVAGSRSITNSELVMKRMGGILPQDKPFEIVSGGAKGIDTIAREYAKLNDIPYTEFPADWNAHGKAAGPIRNKQMAQYADVLLVF